MANSKLPQPSSSFLAFLKQVLQANRGTLLLLFVGVILPLFLFEQLAIVIWQNKGGFLWDESVLLRIHATATPALTQFAANLTRLGGFKAVAMMTAVLSLILLAQQRWRSLVYLLITLIGAGLINRIAKLLLHRMRPGLWDSAAPEFDFAFPSGHATASMTIFVALLILTWGSRWRWLVLFSGSGFVLAIAWTRLYLGVHFPSDILAGWLVSLAWAISVSFVIHPHLTQLKSSNEVRLTIEKTAIVQNQDDQN